MTGTVKMLSIYLIISIHTGTLTIKYIFSLKLHGFRQLDDFQDNPVPVGGLVGFDGFICERGNALDPHLPGLELGGADLDGEPGL